MKDDITNFLNERVKAGDFPSAVYLLAEKGDIIAHEAVGNAVVEPEVISAERDTIYDLASLTKPLITGLLCAALIERHEINLTDKISSYFEGFDTEEKRDITLKNLVTHTSGFKAWLPFYLCPHAPNANIDQNIDFSGVTIRDFVLNEIIRRPLTHTANSFVVYSDLNFILLGFIIEKIYGRDLNCILVTELYEKLGLFRTFFGGADAMRPETAASERGNGFEKQTCIELGFLPASAAGKKTPAFREGVIWGEAHDGNAYYMGGVAGHAGLFSTAEETFKIAQQFLCGYATMLKPVTCDLFHTNFTDGMNEHRSLSFQLASTPDSAAGGMMTPDGFGHLGFTGTSVWIDAVKERVFILLTNRTHHHALPFVNINSVRRRFHNLAIELLDKN